MRKIPPAVALLAVLGFTLLFPRAALAYQAGALKNHSHSSVAGQGGSTLSPALVTASTLTVVSSFTALNGGRVVGTLTVGSLSAGAGFVRQVRITSSTASGTGTNDMVWDTSVPQITEGDQVLASTFTPVSANSILIVRASAALAEETNSSASGFICCMFRDSTANSIGGCRFSAVASNAEISTEHFMYEAEVSVPANATTATVFSLRCGLFGSGAGGVLGWNGAQGGSQKLGGAASTQIRIMEVATQ